MIMIIITIIKIMNRGRFYKGIGEKILNIDSNRFLIFLYNIFCFSFNDCIIEPFIVNSFAPQRIIAMLSIKFFII